MSGFEILLYTKYVRYMHRLVFGVGVMEEMSGRTIPCLDDII